MKKTNELWTDYARRKLEEAGMKFGNYYLNESLSDGLVYICDGEKGDIGLQLTRYYSYDGLLAPLTTDGKLNLSQMFQDGKLTESLEFNLENGKDRSIRDGYARFDISPNGRIKAVDSCLTPKKLFPKIKGVRRVESVLENWAKYVSQISN